MRNNLLKPAALLLAAALCSTPGFAQKGGSKSFTKDETVIIKKDKGDGRTVIEIKDGSVYVNGEAVVTVKDGDVADVRKKIIIEDGDGSGRDRRVEAYGFDRDFEGDFRDMPAPRAPRRAMLGVLTDPKSDQVGAMIKDITPGSPAEEAGLKSGDLITRVDGKTIKDAESLVAEIGAQHQPGDKVAIIYERDGKERTTSAKLSQAQPQVSMRSFRMNPDDMNGDMPNSFFRSFPFNAMDDAAPSPKLGVAAEDRADGEGVRVLSVKPSSPASTAGIKEGDIITRIGNDKVSSVDELQMNLRSIKAGEKVKLEYQRAGKTLTTDVSLPKTVKRKDL
jgi:predicted metalloprotease with PDZ domain